MNRSEAYHIITLTFLTAIFAVVFVLTTKVFTTLNKIEAGVEFTKATVTTWDETIGQCSVEVIDEYKESWKETLRGVIEED